MKTFASYGSLKRGYWNHDRYGLGKPKAISEVYGEMYVNPRLGYPHLMETTDEKPLAKAKFYEVEIYEVEDNVYESINRMEIASGYYPKEITFFTIEKPNEEIKATVWFADPAYVTPNPDHYVEEYKKV